jgi:hypothetical protein
MTMLRMATLAFATQILGPAMCFHTPIRASARIAP